MRYRLIPTVFPAAIFGTLLAVLLIGLSGCSNYEMPFAGGNVLADQGLVGCWSGEDYQPALRQTTRWLIQRNADQTFQIEFGVPGAPPQREIGRWSANGSTYTTVTTSINGEAVEPFDPSYTDTYVLRDVTANSVTYYQSQRKLTFKSVRVACPAKK